MKKNYAIKTAEISKLLNVTAERLRQLATEGRFPKPKRGVWDLAAVASGLIAYLQERLAARRDSPDFLSAREQRMKHQEQLSALALAEKQGKILQRDAVERVWSARVLAARAVVLRSPLSKKEQAELLTELAGAKSEDYL